MVSTLGTGGFPSSSVPLRSATATMCLGVTASSLTQRGRLGRRGRGSSVSPRLIKVRLGLCNLLLTVRLHSCEVRFCSGDSGLGIPLEKRREREPTHLLLIVTFLPGGADLGEVVGAEDANHVDDHREGDDELERGREELTRLEGDAADGDSRLGEALAAEGREEGGDDAVRDRREKAADHTPEIERRREDDDVLGIEHFV